MSEERLTEDEWQKRQLMFDCAENFHQIDRVVGNELHEPVNDQGTCPCGAFRWTTEKMVAPGEDSVGNCGYCHKPVAEQQERTVDGLTANSIGVTNVPSIVNIPCMCAKPDPRVNTYMGLGWFKARFRKVSADG